MKVTVNWLKHYVDFDWSPEELTERLTLLGIEVEGVEAIPGELEGVIVAQVLTRDKHPNADKLSVCRVADGTGERQIVCGAQNFGPGNKVPLILPGSTLPAKPGEKEPFTIKVGKIRGVESHGMMCSADELGLPSQEDGLMILPETAVVGQPLAQHFGLPGSDRVYDLEITPNRPDLNSLIGIAREIAALTGNPLRIPAVSPGDAASTAPISEMLQVQLDAPDLCPRYTARVIRDVRIGPSPHWLRTQLERVGLRSINNVVDVTNFVMWETGQPLHAFNFGALAIASDGIPRIVVRRRFEAETLVTLDGQDRPLPEDALLIADSQRGLALAGVMGGRESEITADTTNVLLESAYFQPTGIRRTSKRTGLRTDASYRFERGADIEIADFASRRAASLITELAGGTLVPGAIDVYPTPAVRKRISLRSSRVNSLLGTTLSFEEIQRHLVQLGLMLIENPLNTELGTITVEIPTFRVDLKREVDLIEEVARMYGVDRIPTTPPRGSIGTHRFDATFDQLSEIRRILTGLGLDEAQGQTLISSKAPRPLPSVGNDSVALANPLSSDMDRLRSSLLTGLLDSLRLNLHQRNGDIRLFEVGRVFGSLPDGIREGWRVGILMSGSRNPIFWSGPDRDAKIELTDLKGILEEFLEAFGISGVVWNRTTASDPMFLESGEITLGGKLHLGCLGQLAPVIARQNDSRDPVFLAELDLDQLLRRRTATSSFQLLPQYPAVRRDLALVVAESVDHDSVLRTVRETKPVNLESVVLFDLFRGDPIPEGFKSLAYAFTYRASDRTLREEEVTATQTKLAEAFERNLQARLRA